MEKELISKIIREFSLNKTICKKFIELIDLISIQIRLRDTQRYSFNANKILSLSNSDKILLPLSKLAIINCSWKYVKILSDISIFTDDRKYMFLIHNSEIFGDRSVSSPIFLREDNIIYLENIILGTFSVFNTGLFKSFIYKIIELSPDNSGVIYLKLNLKGLIRDDSNGLFNYKIKLNSDRYIFLTESIDGPKKSKDIKLTGRKTHSMVKMELNKIARKLLGLNDIDLIVNYGGGYLINEKIRITIELP